LLNEKIRRHDVDCWLINTGWSGGPYGVGERIKIGYTRAMVRAVLDGRLSDVETQTDPIFQLEVPLRCPGVPDELLKPRNTWKDSVAYDRTARELQTRFETNIQQQFKKEAVL
jgi:phosphoenolpyruvate carboxykinase (ATP)